MKIKWTSQKGKQRQLNNDAVAVAYKNNYLVVAIADAAEKVVQGKPVYGLHTEGDRLANYWVKSCVEAITQTAGALTDSTVLMELLLTLQKQLKYYYIYDVASYGILIFNTAISKGNWYFVGDCQLGIVNKQGQVKWLHNPHRANKAFLQKLVPNSDRILTKSLNARRFSCPEHISAIELVENEVLLLATDGYWCEHLNQSIKLEYLDDDCSSLEIKKGVIRSLMKKTDAPNFYFYDDN